MCKYIGYILSVVIIALGIIGARLQNNIPLYMMLATIIAALLLVVFNKVNEKQYPFLVFGITLGLVYQVTLLSNYLIGTDIHYEYYFALQTYENMSWNYAIPHSYNAAVSISVFIPIMARILHIPLEWAFKLIPPLFISCVPVVAYHIFKKEFDTKTAFLSVFFFISVPTMFLELSGLAKQAIAELFLVLCFWAVAYDTFKAKWKRYALVITMGILTVLLHYSMGSILFYSLIGVIMAMAIGKYIFKMKSNIKLWAMLLCAVAVIGFGCLYYGWAADGAAFKDIKGSISIEVSRIDDIITEVPVTTTPATTPIPGTTIPATIPITTTPIMVMPTSTVTFVPSIDSPTYKKHWQYPEAAIAIALGADFMQVDAMSKVYRVFQYITEILIVIGCISIAWNYKKHSLGYMAFLATFTVLLVLVVVYPGFSPILNASRFYNIILLFLSPAAIIGGKLLFRNYKILTIFVLIPYFIFTSGAVYELTKVNDVYRITVPYSHALSALRTDSTGVFTENDIKVRNWIKENDKFPVYGDMWGSTAIFEVQTNLYTQDKVFYFIFPESEEYPRPVQDDVYIFLRERNTEKRELTFYTGVGLRRTITYEQAGFDKELAGREIIYQSGNAIVYGMRGK